MKLKPAIIARAIEAAQNSDVKRAKIGAVAFVDSGHILAVAHNKKVLGAKKRWTLHAEECLIDKIKKLKAVSRFKNVNILVLRMTATGISIAKPCTKCREFLQQMPVCVYYTDLSGVVKRL